MPLELELMPVSWRCGSVWGVGGLVKSAQILGHFGHLWGIA